MPSLGRTLIVIGLLISLIGVAVLFAERLPFRLGRLPGDFVWRGRNATFYFPLATSIVLSLVLSLAMWAIARWK